MSSASSSAQLDPAAEDDRVDIDGRGDFRMVAIALLGVGEMEVGKLDQFKSSIVKVEMSEQ